MFTDSSDEMKAGPSFSITEKIENFIRSFKAKRRETQQPCQYWLWAEMLAIAIIFKVWPLSFQHFTVLVQIIFPFQLYLDFRLP